MNNTWLRGSAGNLLVMATAVAVTMAACGGGGEQTANTTPGGTAAATPPAAASPDTSQGAGAQGSSAMVALGDSIFHGTAGGGICFTCHGADAKGIQGLGPDLTDTTWLHGDGSLDFIKNIVRNGVPTPKEAAAPMPPMGGATLTPAQVDAVSAYVQSLSRR